MSRWTIESLAADTATQNDQTEQNDTKENDMTQYVSTEQIKTPAEIHLEAVRETLVQLAGESGTTESSIARHKEPEHKVSVPETMPLAKAAKTLSQAATDEQEVKEFRLTFKANPYDGAVAFHNVLKTYFGGSGRSVPIMTMFGPQKPQMVDVEVAYDKTVQVAWGQFELALVDGTVTLGGSHDSDYGVVFSMVVEAPKKFAPLVESLRMLIDKELKENSIYKGKAIRITTGEIAPRFWDLQVDHSVVYNADVYDRLDDAVWAPLRHTDMLRNDPETKIDPRVLLFGPYGTGKSECGRLTAKVAVDNGWTFISYDSGRGNQEGLRQALATAKLFAPAVVFVEDIDVYAEASDSGHNRSRLLEMFDGISSKNHEVLVLMTSNKAENMDKGMLRPGRIDDMIELKGLDREASEKLIRLVNKGQLDANVDFDAVYKAVEGFEPAFLRRTFVKARQRALVRTADELKAKGAYTDRAAHDFLLTTDDFVGAANIMRPQHQRHSEASDHSKPVTIDSLIVEAVADSVARAVTFDNGNIGELEVSVVEPGDRVEKVS